MIPDDVQALHARLASKARALYRMVELDDIKQTLWVAYFCSQYYLEASQKPVEGFEGEGEGEDTREAFEALRKEMWNAAERYCRREKAHAEGYGTGDEMFYSSGALKPLLEAWFSAGVTADPPKGPAESVTRAKVSAETGDYMVSMIDVGDAIRRLAEPQKKMLYYGFSPDYAGRTDEEIALELRNKGWKNLTEKQFKRKLWRAIRALQRNLGGSSPWQKAA